MFSKSCEYAIRAAVFVAGRSLRGNRCSISEIAAQTGAPVAFTGKILQILTREGIITSFKGPGGGFGISKMQMKRVMLSDIIDVIDGESIYSGCVLGLRQCSEKNPCPMHEQFKSIRNDLKKTLKKTSLFTLASDFDQGNGVLKT